MFFGSGLFYFLMGIIFVVVAFGFKAFADDRGWVMTWWKALLAIIWYTIFSLSFLTYGTLVGENEAGAGFRALVFGLFVSLILGVGLWRLMSVNPKSPEV